METIKTIVAGTPLRWWIAGAGLLAIAAQACLMLVAVRRRALQRRLRLRAEAGDWEAVAAAPQPRTTIEVVALAALLAVPAAAVMAVERARDLLRAALAETDPAALAQLAAAGWKGQLNAISLGIVLLELAGGLGVIAWSFAFAARRQIAGLKHGARIAALDPRGAEAWARFASPETETVLACAGSVAAMVLLPSLHGAFSYCVLLGKRLGAVALAAPSERLAQMDGVLREARRALDAGTTASQLGLVLAAVTCGALIWWRSPRRARRQWLGRPERRVPGGARAGAETVWGTLACLFFAVTLYLVSRPLQAENELPWPPFDTGGVHLATSVRTADVVGPDRLPRAPLLEVTRTAARLEGKEVDAEGLARQLEALRRDDSKIDPLDPETDDIIVVCERDTPARWLNPLLSAAKANGFRRPVFAFTSHETMHRPTLGTFTRTRTTAAETELCEREPAAGA
jgi:hypothetical protein